VASADTSVKIRARGCLDGLKVLTASDRYRLAETDQEDDD
jgi:hypothetical protein